MYSITLYLNIALITKIKQVIFMAKRRKTLPSMPDALSSEVALYISLLRRDYKPFFKNQQKLDQLLVKRVKQKLF